MKDWVIDDDNLSIERKSILPGEGFFVPDSFEEAKEEAEAEAALAGAEVAVVADPDADGLACTALVREVYGDAALIDAGPHDLGDALERVADYSEPGAEIFVCDLCPDSYDEVGEALEVLVERAGEVRWFDHHQWTDSVAEAVRDAGVELVVGDSDEECTADVAVRSLDYEFPEYLVELAAVTRDHDLWIRDDERSDDLADYSYWADPEEYIETVAEHGADLPEDVREFLAEMRVEKDALIEKAVARADIEEIGPWTVGVTYGRCSQNEVAVSPASTTTCSTTPTTGRPAARSRSKSSSRRSGTSRGTWRPRPRRPRRNWTRAKQKKRGAPRATDYSSSVSCWRSYRAEVMPSLAKNFRARGVPF